MAYRNTPPPMVSASPAPDDEPNKDPDHSGMRRLEPDPAVLEGIHAAVLRYLNDHLLRNELQHRGPRREIHVDQHVGVLVAAMGLNPFVYEGALEWALIEAVTKDSRWFWHIEGNVFKLRRQTLFLREFVGREDD